MATIEKLIVQIFDRKRQIIEQLNQQKVLFDQQLASKLLIQGISPPPWLFPSPDLSGLNKEELITGLLFPHPGPFPSHSNGLCFSYDKPYTAPADSRITDYTCAEKCTSSDSFDQVESGVLPLHHVVDNEKKDAIAPSSHVDVRAVTISCVPMSPDVQIGTGMSDKYPLHDHICAEKCTSSDDFDQVQSGVVPLDHIEDNVETAEIVPSSHVDLSTLTLSDVPRSPENPFGTRNSDKYPLHDYTCAENCSSSDGLNHVRSGAVPPVHVDDNEKSAGSCRSSQADVSAVQRSYVPMSPEDSIGIRISDKYPLHDHTCAENCTSSDGLNHVKSGTVPPVQVDDNEKSAGSRPLSQAVVSADQLSYVPMSPEDRIGARISDKNPLHDQSLVKMQRSRSRQKALELRNSAQASGKSRLGLNSQVSNSPGSKFCAEDEQVDDLKESFELADPSSLPIEFRWKEETAIENYSKYKCNSDGWDASLALPTSNEPCEQQTRDKGKKGKNSYISSGRITRSRSSNQQTIPIASEGKSFECVQRDDSTGTQCVKSSTDGSISKLSSSYQQPIVGADLLDRKISHVPIRMTRSQSGKMHHAETDDPQDRIISGSGNYDNRVIHADHATGVSSIQTCKIDDSWPLYKQRKTGDQNSSTDGSISKLRSPYWQPFVGADLLDRKISLVPIRMTRSQSGKMRHAETDDPQNRIISRSINYDNRVIHADNATGDSSIQTCKIDGSWPSYKRRKIGDRSLILSTSPSLGMNPLSPIVQDIDCAAGCPSRKLELVPQVQHPEDDTESGRRIVSPFSLNDQELSATNMLNAREAMIIEFAEGSSEEEKVKANQASSIIHSPWESGSLVNNHDVDGMSYRNLADSDMEDIKSLPFDNKQNISIASPLIERMDVAQFDQTFPEFEGFGAQDFGGEIVCGEAPLTSDITERTILPELICKSARLTTPVSPFSAAGNLYFKPGIYSSVPKGLLENFDLGTTLLPSGSPSEGKSHSDIFPFPRSQCGWDVRKPFLSPVEKGFESIVSKSSGSSKVGSGNPELTCFTILEDPETCDEDGNELAEAGVEGTASSAKRSLIRNPLCDINVQNRTSLAQPPNSPIEKLISESVSTKYSVSGTHNMDSDPHCMGQRRSRRTTQGKENNGFSIGDSTKKHSEGLSSRFSKSKLSGQPSLRSRGRSISEKEPKRNNIVSNLKSFIPLVQQKQVAAAAPAKRDVKVKALEAAEAAKRLAEKKENERKQKKEALKLERARMEQESLKQMELTKKLKQEAKKKREAENEAKKRQREEEEMKEKERKRKRLEEAFCQQKQAEEKLNAWREGSRSVAEVERADERKIEHKKPQVEVGKANYGSTSMKPANAFNTSGDVRTEDGDNLVTGSSDFGTVCVVVEAESSTPTLDKMDRPSLERNLEQSYDISPYQCSDDEEDEEDEMPTKKFIPSWASKSCVSLALSSSQHLDPDMIFHPGSFCSLEEVLVPRRIPQK